MVTTHLVSFVPHFPLRTIVLPNWICQRWMGGSKQLDHSCPPWNSRSAGCETKHNRCAASRSEVSRTGGSHPDHLWVSLLLSWMWPSNEVHPLLLKYVYRYVMNLLWICRHLLDWQVSHSGSDAQPHQLFSCLSRQIFSVQWVFLEPRPQWY